MSGKPFKGSWEERNRARFWRAVRIGGPDECWPWLGRLHRKGYGEFDIGHGKEKAHRFAWADKNGEIPEGMHVLHSCDNRPCCNPTHLRPGTNAENVEDRMARGRQAKGAGCGRARFSELDVADIRAAVAQGQTQRALAAVYGCHHGAIGSIVRGETWRHSGAPVTARRSNKAGADNGGSVLTPEQVAAARVWLADGVSRADIQARLAVSKSCIQRLAAGDTWQ